MQGHQLAAPTMSLPETPPAASSSKPGADADADMLDSSEPFPAGSGGHPPSEGAGSADERKRSGQLKTRERNRKAQHAYRQRNKVKHQSQETRIKELEQRVAELQQAQQQSGQDPSEEASWSGRDTSGAQAVGGGAGPPPGVLAGVPRQGSQEAKVCGREVQDLVPHPEWAEFSPLPLPQLYSALVEGHLDLHLPLPHMHPERSVSLQQIAEMSLPEFAAFVTPCAAYLSFCSSFCRDPTSAASRKFSAMAAEAFCVRIVLAETRPVESSQLSGQHLLQMTGTQAAQPPPNWSLLKDVVGLSEYQKALVRDVWQQYTHSMLGVSAERSVHPTDLAASAAIQQETFLHLLRIFVVQILTPFQVGHFMARSYPYAPSWGEILMSIAQP